MKLTPDQHTGYDKATFLCSKSEYCSSDIQDKLKIWGLAPEDIDVVIEKLTEEKYIDDERFARAYVKDKSKFNGWGKQKIAFMLRNKKIASEIIRLAFEEIEDDGYLDQLRKLLTNKAKIIKSANKFDQRNKLMRFAMGRGFETDQINRVLRELDHPEEED